MTNTKDLQEYLLRWVNTNNKVAEQGFTWGSLEEGDEWHQYMSLDVHKFTQEQFDAITLATEKVGEIYNKMYHKLIDGSSESIKWRSMLGLPIETLDASVVASQLFSYFTRLDLIVNGDEIKVIEVNCDTPTGYLETAVANRVICEEQGYESPNQLEDAIYKAWTQIIMDYEITHLDTVYFTAYGWHDEDRETVLFNMKHSYVLNKKFIPVEDIVVAEDGLYDSEGQKIKFLYRLYPLEYLVDDTDSFGDRIGLKFLNHIAEGNVKIINPSGAFLMQSKAVMALIWSLRDNRDVFSEEDEVIIEKHFLSTYFNTLTFAGKNPFVAKPIFGREGGSVQIYNDLCEVIEEDEEDHYGQWKKVYQKYVEMPNKTINTWDGEYTGKLLVGSFLINGKSSGLFLRVGEKITGNLSMFCGVTVEEEIEK